MGRKRYLHSVLIMTFFAMIISISAVCAMAESSVDITQPADGSTVKPGYVEVWTRFAQPPNIGDIAITEGQASYINSHYGVSYSPVHYKVYKDGNLFAEQDANQAKLNFTTSGSKSTTFLFEDEGIYTIQASVPQTSGEYSSVTINVEGEYDGVDYSNSAFDSTDSDTITEGIPVRTTLTPDNYFSTTYKLTPAKSGWYVFFSSGYTKRIRATLYEGIGGKSSVTRVTSDYDYSGQFGFSAELTAGTSYTLHIEGYVRKTETVFDVGFFSKESGIMMASASEITLTDPNRTYRFGVCQGTPIPESAHWVIEDDSIVGSDSSSSFSRGTPEYDTYYNGATITLNARKNGSTIVRYVDSDVTYVTCKIICKDIPENNGSDNQCGDDEQKPDEPTDAEKAAAEAKNDLNKAVDDAKAITQGNYTDESFKALQDAIAEAEALAKDSNATAAQMKAASEKVVAAKAALKEKEESVKVGDTKKYKKNTYKVLSVKSKTVAFTKAKNAKSIVVPATIKINGKTYKVTQINANAFKGKKIRTVTIGKNVKTIKKNTFKESKATKLILKTKLLKKAKVKGCLKGSKINTIQVKVSSKKSVNKKYVKSYKKIFTKTNAGKKVSVNR